MLSDFPQRFLALQRVFLAPPPVPPGSRTPAAKPPDPPREFRVMTARLLGGGNKRLFPLADPADAARTGPWAGQVHHALIKLAGINDPEAANPLRGYLLQLPLAEAWPLPPTATTRFSYTICPS